MYKLLVYGNISAAEKTGLEKEFQKTDFPIRPSEMIYKDNTFSELKTANLRKENGILNVIFWNTNLEKIKRFEQSIHKNMETSEEIVLIAYNSDGHKLPASTTLVMFCKTMSCIKPYLKFPAKKLTKVAEEIVEQVS